MKADTERVERNRSPSPLIETKARITRSSTASADAAGRHETEPDRHHAVGAVDASIGMMNRAATEPKQRTTPDCASIAEPELGRATGRRG
jgi:hypothetical protein